jgi:hypothetical protein
MTGYYKNVILIPVFNDWPSLESLLIDVTKYIEPLTYTKFVLVDDGSTKVDEIELYQNFVVKYDATVIELTSNIGSQRALAIGMCYALDNIIFDRMVIMDADGQDNPKYLPKILYNKNSLTDAVVLSRKTRQENYFFKAMYKIYKKIFRILTGFSIDFGNFSSLSYSTLNRISYIPDLWNHYPSTLIKSGVNIVKIPSKRLPRKIGNSKLGYSGLIKHGLNSMSVFVETIFQRVLVILFTFGSIALLLLLSISYLKLFTKITIPGWTSIVSFIFLAIFLQLFSTVLVLIFTLMSNRKIHILAPRNYYHNYINKIYEQ